MSPGQKVSGRPPDPPRGRFRSRSLRQAEPSGHGVELPSQQVQVVQDLYSGRSQTAGQFSAVVFDLGPGVALGDDQLGHDGRAWEIARFRQALMGATTTSRII